MRSSILLFSILLLICGSSFSETLEDLTILADSIGYSQDGTSIEARGSVEAVSKDIHIKANHLIYIISDKHIIADQGYEMDLKTGFTLKGDSLDYSMKSKRGITENVRIYFKRTVITGAHAKIDDEKIELDNASFNSCGLEPPHYQVSSATTTLYPQEGWVLGYYGLLWINQVPVLPVPVYVFDLSLYSLKKRTTRTGDVIGLPEIGSNDEDGAYAIERIPWIANRRLSGRLVLADTQNGGLAGGVDGNWIYDEYDDIHFRLMYDKRYDLYGGMTHTIRFGPPLGTVKEDVYTFLQIKENMMFELTTNISIREMNNYQRVSTLPEVTLRMNNINAFFDNFSIGAEIAYGHISEETYSNDDKKFVYGFQDDRGRLKLNGGFNYNLDIGRLYAGMTLNQSWYGRSDSWRRLNHLLKLSRDLGYGCDGYISHLHYLLFEGNSPFLFERYYTIPSDEFGLGLGYNFYANRLTLDYAYYVPDGEPKDLDYGLSIGFHCYSLGITYRATRKELLFGVSLITGQ